MHMQVCIIIMTFLHDHNNMIYVFLACNMNKKYVYVKAALMLATRLVLIGVP